MTRRYVDLPTDPDIRRRSPNPGRNPFYFAAYCRGHDMGIRFSCPNGHKLNVKTFLAGKRGVCPQCGAKFEIPIQAESQNSNLPQAGSINQSRSADVISPGAVQTAMVNGSPSIM